MGLNCSEWLELGPPPDTILTLPPPPLPAFLQVAATTTNNSVSSCNNLLLEGGSLVDDTWLLVLISCSVGVLMLGSLLALLLLKCREERGSKTVPVRVEGLTGPVKKSCEAVLYPGDSRVLWATLTPRGTTRTVAAAHLTTFDNTGFTDEYRPRVSSPTRIEHPNLPPLNLHRTIRRIPQTAPSPPPPIPPPPHQLQQQPQEQPQSQYNTYSNQHYSNSHQPPLL
ncbi:uncharacterized protein isoform X2 [Rhodnius prolixus]|uniref:uncharacterized protein isoform X2 n=1 Tax=Rhodnius prolixus TaxID=13249 RepID=UPI003D18AF9A